MAAILTHVADEAHPVLVQFLDHQAARPFVWGQSDCALLAADWVQVVRGVDPATHLRGTYGDARSCLHLLAQHGGIERIMQDCATRAGLVMVAPDLPLPGDVATVCVRASFDDAPRERLIGALRTPCNRWAMRTPRGLLVAGAPATMVWRV